MASSRRPKRVRVRRTPPPTLTAEQIDRIIATANAEPRLHPTGALVRFLSETGLRFSELCRLRTDNVDINNRRLFVPGRDTEGRYIPLTPCALNALQSLHEDFFGSTFVLGDKAEFVLRRVSRSFRHIAAQVGVAGCGLHSLRRLYVKRLVAGGIDPMLVARLIGNQHPRLTVLRYLRAAGDL